MRFTSYSSVIGRRVWKLWRERPTPRISNVWAEPLAPTHLAAFVFRSMNKNICQR